MHPRQDQAGHSRWLSKHPAQLHPIRPRSGSEVTEVQAAVAVTPLYAYNKKTDTDQLPLEPADISVLAKRKLMSLSTPEDL
jgi:hypothetical protein